MPSFDIVSKIDTTAVDNALAGVTKEMDVRYDFKGSACSIERTDEALLLKADDDLKLKQVTEVLNVYLTRRKVDVGAFDFGTVEMASGNSVRQTVAIKQGVEREAAQKIVKAVKEN